MKLLQQMLHSHALTLFLPEGALLSIESFCARCNLSTTHFSLAHSLTRFINLLLFVFVHQGSWHFHLS